MTNKPIWEQQPRHFDDQLRRVPPVIKFVRIHPDAIEPKSQYRDDAGYDLFTCSVVEIPPGEWRDVPVGLNLQPPPGYWLRLVGRSSTFRKRGLLVIEGIVDGGYRGDIYFGVWNSTRHTVRIERGERIAQAIFGPILHFPWVEVDELDESDRQGAGFGSTGT